MKTLPTIFKRTSTGAVQTWYGELDGTGRYRTISGQQGGKLTESEWTVCEPKNVGRSNATTAVEQAEAELNSMYTKKLEREYHRKIEDIDNKRFIKPMLADKWKDRKNKMKPGMIVAFQPKLDGMRAIASFSSITKSNVVLTSRDGKIIPGAGHICEALSPLFEQDPDLILDGELYNHDYKDKFEALISALKREPKTDADRERARSVVQYHIYDLPSEAHLPFSERILNLEALFRENVELHSDMFHFVKTNQFIWDEDGESLLSEFMSEALEAGYEGGMVRLNAPYEFKRSKSLLKMKEFMDEEFEIVDIEEGKGNWAGYAKVAYIKLKDGRVSKSTIKGNQAYCKELLEKKDEAIGKLGTVTFFRYTNDGVPYLPVFKGVRWDV